MSIQFYVNLKTPLLFERGLLFVDGYSHLKKSTSFPQGNLQVINRINQIANTMIVIIPAAAPTVVQFSEDLMRNP